MLTPLREYALSLLYDELAARVPGMESNDIVSAIKALAPQGPAVSVTNHNLTIEDSAARVSGRDRLLSLVRAKRGDDVVIEGEARELPAPAQHAEHSASP